MSSNALKKVAIGAPVKNVAGYLPRLLQVLSKVSDYVDDTRLVLAENDSTDATYDIAAEYVRKNTKAKVLTFPGLDGLMAVPTDRLAFLRNTIVEEIQMSANVEDDWYAVFLDADNVTSQLNVGQILELVAFLQSNPQFAAATASSTPVYYDIWTLRSDECPYDCWSNVLGRPATMSYEEAVIQFVSSHQRPIPVDAAPISVQSAFGGLGAYRLADLKACRYDGRGPRGRPASDHVSFNFDLTNSTGRPIAVVPHVQVLAPPEHLGQHLPNRGRPPTPWLSPIRRGRALIRGASRRARARVGIRIHRVSMSHGKTRPDLVRREVDEYRLFMTADHALPGYTRRYQAYDRPIRAIGLALRRHYGRRLRVIDIGANVGDTAISLVVASGSDVLAVEGDPEFLRALTANVAPLGKRVSVVPQYVTPRGDTYRATKSLAGTGHLVRGPLDPLHTAAGVRTRPLAEVLKEVDWYTADLFKSDTGGHDFELVEAALDVPWQSPPVLFFECDPSLDPGGSVSALAVVERAVAGGYSRWYVWDNFGNFLCTVSQNYSLIFGRLFSYLERCKESGGGLYYFDVAAFSEHHPAFDGLVPLRYSRE